MLAYIAVSKRTINRIRHRVHPDISVRMTFQGFVMRHFYATKNNMIAILERMYIKAVAQTNIHSLLQYFSSPREIVGHRYL
jgi:metal-dependent HD superfamily phosphatase/phosphodiesterase